MSDLYKKELIENAIKLLKENGYAVRKISKAMELASKECEEMCSKGKDMECFGCACSVCIMI